MVVGQAVSFPSYDRHGEETILSGVIIGEFREPPEEDRYQRLNYQVRTPDGEVHTPYADDCRPD